MALRALPAVAFLLRPVFGGVGGSVVSLSTCASEKTFQQWAYSATNKHFEVVVSSDALRLWGTSWCISTGTGIGELPVAPNTPIFTSPCGSGLALGATPDTARTALALTDGSGLCVAVSPPGALPGVVLTLAACASPVPDSQAFRFTTSTGALVHAASGLCVDSGTRFRGCAAGSLASALPFCDAAVPVDARVADLISRLSFPELVNMLSSASGGAPSLGVSPVQWWAESLHGVANNVGVAFDAPTPAATAFPQPITSSCSFNRSLWLATGQAVSDEVRAFANVNPSHSGLTLWAPNINIASEFRPLRT
jgi:hypothetical protein